MTPKRFLENWANAFLGGKVDDIVAFYESSDDVVAIQSTGEVRKGIREIRKEYEAAFKEVIFQNVILESLSVLRRGNMAWASGRFKAHTLRRSDKSEWTLETHSSFVLTPADDTWRIVLEHMSRISDVPRVQPRSHSEKPPSNKNPKTELADPQGDEGGT